MISGKLQTTDKDPGARLLYSLGLNTLWATVVLALFAGCSEPAVSGASLQTATVGKALNASESGETAGLRFDGVDDTVLMPDEQAFDVGTEAFTLSAWVRIPAAVPSTYHARTIAAKNIAAGASSNYDGYSGYKLYTAYGNACFRVSYGGNDDLHACSPDPLERDRWVHLAGRRQGDTISVHVNGIQAAEFDIPAGSNLDSTEPFAVGAVRYKNKNGLWAESFFTGDIDDVALIKRALTDDELAQQVVLGPDLGDPSVLGFWSFDDGTGSDTSGGGHDATIQDATPIVDGAVHSPTALAFDGFNDAVQLLDPSDLNFGADEFSLSAWVWLPADAPSFGARTIAGKGLPRSTGQGRGYRLYLDSGRLAFEVQRGRRGEILKVNVPQPLERERWTHVVGVRRPNMIQLYVDGVLVDTRSVPPGANFGNNIPFALGASYPQLQHTYWEGRIDEVAVFSRALNPLEARALAELEQEPLSTGLAAYWTFDRALLADVRPNPAPGSELSPLVERDDPVIAPGIGVLPRDTRVGPFTLNNNNRIVTFYLVSPGLGATADVHVEAVDQSPGARSGRAMIRVFDPDEKLMHWSLEEDIQTGQSVPVATDVPVVQGPIELSRPGVYQVRVTAAGAASRVWVDLPATVGHGFSHQNGRFKIAWCPPENPACHGAGVSPILPEEVWAWAPRHPTRALFLQVRPTVNDGVPLMVVPTVVRQQEGALSAVPAVSVPGTAGDVRYVVEPGVDDPGELWKFDFGGQLNWDFAAAGMPLIFSDSKQAAEAIHASVERVPSGPYQGALVSHKFQLKIAELMPQILAGIGDTDLFNGTAADGTSIASYPSRKACVEPTDVYDVYRHRDLLHDTDSVLALARWGLGAFPFDEPEQQPIQITDPTNFWAGTLGTPFYGRQTCVLDMDCTAGNTCSAGLCSGSFDPTVDRWDVLRKVSYAGISSGLPGGPLEGLSMKTSTAASWGLFATWSHPCNPWGPTEKGGAVPNPQLVYRAAATALADLMTVAEGETFHGVVDFGPYAGKMGIALADKLPAYEYTAPHLRQLMPGGLGDEVRAVWAEGLRRVIDRTYPDNPDSDSNQSIRYALAYEQFARGSRDDESSPSGIDLPFANAYGQLARDWVKRYQAWTQSVSSAGWSPESMGPDASYAGIQHWYLGHYLRLTEMDYPLLEPDLVARSLLRDSYNFYNHTVVEEPDGKVTSGSNMNHREGDGFNMEQYSGAQGIVIDMPEVDVWTQRTYPTDAAGEANARASLQTWAKDFDDRTRSAHLREKGGKPEIALFFGPPPQPFPAEPSSQADVGSEMHTFENDSYSIAIYAAHPITIPDYFAGNWPITRAIPLARPTSGGQWVGIEDVAPDAVLPIGDTSVDVGKGSPMVGGGITILGSKALGAAVVSTNWSPLAHHGLVAVLADGQRYWEDYVRVSRVPLDSALCADVFDAPAEHDFSVYGLLEQTSICYARHYDFHAQSVEVLLELQGGQISGASTRLFENIPVPTCTRLPCSGGSINNQKSSGATLWDRANGTPFTSLTQLSASALDLRNDAQEVMLSIDFVNASGGAAEQTLTVSPDGLRRTHYSREFQLGRVEVELPKDASQLNTLRYFLQLPQ